MNRLKSRDLQLIECKFISNTFNIEIFHSIKSKSKGEREMWTPAIIATIVTFTTIILITILEKKEKIKQGTKLYKLIEVIGLYIPILVICTNYGYMKTDTFKETIIVLSGIYICIALLGLLTTIGKTNKYNYIFFPIILLGCYYIINYITPYMLTHLDRKFLSGFIGAISGALTVNCSKNKVKLIISSVIVISIIITAPINFLSDFENNSKVENVVIEYMENHGYDINDYSKLTILSNSTRKEPIRLLSVSVNSDNESKHISVLNIVYFNGEVIEFKEE